MIKYLILLAILLLSANSNAAAEDWRDYSSRRTTLVSAVAGDEAPQLVRTAKPEEGLSDIEEEDEDDAASSGGETTETEKRTPTAIEGFPAEMAEAILKVRLLERAKESAMRRQEDLRRLEAYRKSREARRYFETCGRQARGQVRARLLEAGLTMAPEEKRRKRRPQKSRFVVAPSLPESTNLRIKGLLTPKDIESAESAEDRATLEATWNALVGRRDERLWSYAYTDRGKSRQY